MKKIICLLLWPLFMQAQTAAKIEVNTERLEKRIADLSQFGKMPNGESQRVAYSDADIQARAFVIKMMEEAGLEVHIDVAGNLIGNRMGTDPNAPLILFGSHIDMVPNGGNYDGCVGSMAAIEVVQTLKENNIQTLHPLQVIIFTDEEGGLVGSRALAGILKPTALSVKNSTGYTVEEGIRRLGGNPELIEQVARKSDNLKAFFELHIEQGPYLDQTDTQIGIVEGIVGIKWWDVEFEGLANHGGTTAMNNRKDALVAAARFITAVNETALQMEGRQVATVGRIEAKPGAPNVIPGYVKTSLEIRDLSAAKIAEVYRLIYEKAQAISQATGVNISFKPIDAASEPAMTDVRIQKTIEQATKKLGYSYMYLPSGAGHDAQDMAKIVPTGMIFVPSKDGISHSPNEFTSSDAMARGANVLLQSILLTDGQ